MNRRKPRPPMAMAASQPMRLVVDFCSLVCGRVACAVWLGVAVAAAWPVVRAVGVLVVPV